MQLSPFSPARRPRLVLIAALLLPSTLLPARGASAATASTTGELPPAVVEKIDAAKEAMSKRDYQSAIRDLKTADKLAGGQCAACQIGLAKAYNGAGAYKEVLKTLEKTFAATEDPQILALAWNEQGLALAAWAGTEKPDMEKLAGAEAAFRKAIGLSLHGDGSSPQLNLGVVLMRMAKDEDGKAELEKFLAANPNSPNAAMARDLVANPLRARKRIFPDIDFVTLTGEYLSSADLRGKVVLIDFWGTWCPPCRAAVPSLHALAHRQAKNPFLLVSVSSDTDEAVLKAYVAAASPATRPTCCSTPTAPSSTAPAAGATRSSARSKPASATPSATPKRPSTEKNEGQKNEGTGYSFE